MRGESVCQLHLAVYNTFFFSYTFFWESRMREQEPCVQLVDIFFPQRKPSCKIMPTKVVKQVCRTTHNIYNVATIARAARPFNSISFAAPPDKNRCLFLFDEFLRYKT